MIFFVPSFTCVLVCLFSSLFVCVGIFVTLFMHGVYTDRKILMEFWPVLIKLLVTVCSSDNFYIRCLVEKCV